MKQALIIIDIQNDYFDGGANPLVGSREAGLKVIDKNFPNSFRGTTLLDHLRSDGVADLVICGMMTRMCVDATVRAAKDFGFSCTVIGDACATKDLETGGETVYLQLTVPEGAEAEVVAGKKTKILSSGKHSL